MERKSRLISAGISVFLVSCVLGVAFSARDLNAQAAGPHDPILILSDSDFTSANGVVSGDGSMDNPYIIEGWEIDAPSGNAIEVVGTTSWFEIRNVVVSSSGYSIYLDNAAHATINSTIVRSDEYSIMVIGCPGCVIVGNHATATYGAIVAGYADGYVIRGNEASIEDEGAPIAIGLSNGSLVEENTVTGDRGNGIYVIECEDTIVRSNTVGPSGCLIENCANCTFWDNTFDLSGFGVSGESGDQLGTLEISVNNTANGRPIHYLKNLVDAHFDGVLAGQIIIANCSGLTVSNITVQNVTNSWEPSYTAGLECLWNENLTLDNLTLRGNAVGMTASHCPNIRIQGCNFSDNPGVGATIEDSAGTNVTGCSFRKSEGSGVAIYNSPRSVIRNCTVTECGGLGVRVTQCDDSVVTEVTQSWSDGNGIGLGDCDNVTVTNCTMAFNGMIYYSGYGLVLGSLTNSMIANNSILENRRGVEISSCSDTGFIGNEIRGNHEDGIDVQYCSYCLIGHNRVIGNTVAGIWLSDFSDNVNVTWNVLEGNNYGIYYQLLYYTTVHHNDFGGNMANAYTHVPWPDNSWDDGYPSGGNYWSDYSGVDNFNGPAQDIPGSDGIGDVPYQVRGGGTTSYYDRYPFMNPLMISSNTAPVAAFTITPSTGNVSTEFILNASSSYDVEDPSSELEVRWDIGYNGTWEIDWTKEKVATWKFTTPGDNYVRLQVRDTRLYLGDAASTVFVTDEPPTASFVVAPAIGNSSTSFVFDASSSSDLEYGPGPLVVRWDWENDGTWDTDWSTIKLTAHSFATDGTHTVALEVKDSANLSGTTTRQVVVDSIVPLAVAGADQSVEVGASVTLDGSGSTDNMAIANYSWSCEVDGEVKKAYGVSSVWSFNEPGVYEVVLTVKDTAGNAASDIVEITVTSEDTGGGILADYWWAIAAIAIVIVAGVALLLLRRRK